MNTPTPPAGSSLTQEQKTIMIAEACGWKIHPITSTGLPDVIILPPGIPLTEPNAWAYAGKTLPDYFHDLNACHEMEGHLGGSAIEKYETLLQGKTGRFYWSASDRLRAEAFGLTLNLWTNS